MSGELEAAAAGSLAGVVGRRKGGHGLPVGAPCPNCATPLAGPWCHACGQSAADYHRSTLHLCGEALEGVLHFDGRLWRTLPDLMARPGRLTRAYLDGHRAPQIPPLRLFLVVLVAIFLVGGLTGGRAGGGHRQGATTVKAANGATVTVDATDKSYSQLSPADRQKAIDKLNLIDFHLPGNDPSDIAAAQWLRDRVVRTLADPERFTLILEQWAERFAFLMLPVSALLMGLVFIFQRRFYLFDHTIFSLHSLSAMGVLIITAMLASLVVGDGAYLLIFYAPVHLFMHLRGVYRTSVIGTLIRMTILFWGALIAALVLILGLIAVGLNGMGG